MRILAADVGGTKTAVAILEIDETSLRPVRERRFESASHSGLESILAAFLEGDRAPRAAGIGVAGPVRGGNARVTKLSWTIETRRLERRFPGISFHLVNDFVANALGLPRLSRRGFRTLVPARGEPGGPIALLGAGTGLGEAGMLRVAGRYEPFPSEGGHKDFAPRDEREARFASFLTARTGRAEWDRVLSGEGLVHLYEFLRAEGAVPESPRAAAALAESDDRAATISALGLGRSDPLSTAALDLFASLYGAEAGNVALQYRATGGVYVAGGIAAKIFPALARGGFAKAFRDKPPLTALLEAIPVRVVVEPRLGLFGAGAAGYRMVMDETRPSSKRTSRRTPR